MCFRYKSQALTSEYLYLENDCFSVGCTNSTPISTIRIVQNSPLEGGEFYNATSSTLNKRAMLSITNWGDPRHSASARPIFFCWRYKLTFVNIAATLCGAWLNCSHPNLESLLFWRHFQPSGFLRARASVNSPAGHLAWVARLQGQNLNWEISIDGFVPTPYARGRTHITRIASSLFAVGLVQGQTARQHCSFRSP